MHIVKEGTETLRDNDQIIDLDKLVEMLKEQCK
jgi:hypothetical protein